jgi:type IV pilus assembly protein PilM
MLGFVKDWFARPASPIGVDIGTDTIRVAQCVHDGREWQLAAAACTDVPAGMREPSEERTQFLVDALRDLVGHGNFRGKQAVLCIPSSLLQIQHVRMPRLTDAETKKALPWELKGKLTIDPHHAVLRHLIAGEIEVNGEPKNEVVVMATPRQTVEQFLKIASRAKLEVIGMNVEPKAIVDCFGHVYRRKNDAEITSLFIDIGCRTTRVIIARGQDILFARAIDIAGDALSNAVASGLKIDFEQAKLLRIKLAATPIQRPQPSPAVPPPAAEAEEPVSENHSFALLGLAPREERRTQEDTIAIVTPALPQDLESQAGQVEYATSSVVASLCDELNLCRRYFEGTFTQNTVDRIVFIGGEARQRAMCQRIAQTLGLAAQLGDPLVRMGKTTSVGPESGIDPKQPQPAWAVALGLSMGPVALPQAARKSA